MLNRDMTEGERQVALNNASKEYMLGNLTLEDFERRERAYGTDYQRISLEAVGFYSLSLGSLVGSIGRLFHPIRSEKV